MTRSPTTKADPAAAGSRLRRVGAALCALIAAVYVLIGTETVTVVESTEDAVDVGVFGFGAAAVFILGGVLLLTQDRRGLWAVGAVLQVMIIAMYLGIGADRTPSYEAWGLGLRIPQLALLGVLLVLAIRPTVVSAGGRVAVDEDAVREFLGQRRIAVVGVSDAKDNFGRTVYQELRSHGYDVVPVTTAGPTVLGDDAYRRLDDVPGPIDGVIVMVHRDHAVPVVKEAVDREIPRVWLFRGAGGPGAVSDAAIEQCERAGATVITGACPLMFLEPAAAIHRIHRGVRHMNGSLANSA